MYVSLASHRSNAPLPSPPDDVNVDISHLTTNLHVNLEVLAADIKELENQIYHLNRSNTELREFLEREPEEKEYQSAIFENVTVIAKKLEKLAKLKQLQDKIMGSGSTPTSTTTTTTTTDSGSETKETNEETVNTVVPLLL